MIHESVPSSSISMGCTSRGKSNWISNHPVHHQLKLSLHFFFPSSSIYALTYFSPIWNSLLSSIMQERNRGRTIGRAWRKISLYREQLETFSFKILRPVLTKWTILLRILIRSTTPSYTIVMRRTSWKKRNPWIPQILGIMRKRRNKNNK